MQFGAFLMPTHAPETPVADGQAWDLEGLERLDRLGFEGAWIGEHFTATWEPCPAPDLLIAQALPRTRRIRLGTLGHLLPYHHTRSSWRTGPPTSTTWRRAASRWASASARCRPTTRCSAWTRPAGATGA